MEPSFVLKHEPVIDIFTVAIGFVLRVYAGAVALTVPVSSWMFITTLSLALYLAAVKRRQELTQGGTEAVTRVIIDSEDAQGRRWSTVGVSANIIDASFEALLDSIRWKLIRDCNPVNAAGV